MLSEREENMPYHPMKRRDFEKKIRELGWHLEKGSIDWKLYDEKRSFSMNYKK